jgi:hypothetical protein
LVNTLRHGHLIAPEIAHLIVVPLELSSGLNETWKSKLKSLS